jgi:hypothetical protein
VVQVVLNPLIVNRDDIAQRTRCSLSHGGSLLAVWLRLATSSSARFGAASPTYVRKILYVIGINCTVAAVWCFLRIFESALNFLRVGAAVKGKRMSCSEKTSRPIMTTSAEEYHSYAQQCLRWAD